MLDKDVRIGDRVTVNADREYAEFWEQDVLTVVGLYLHRDHKELDICLEDSTGFRSDGWLSSDLTEAIEVTIGDVPTEGNKI